MRNGLLNFLYFGVGAAFLTAVAMIVFLPFMSWGAGDTDPADGIGALSLVLGGFSWPVLLNLDWWVTVGLLGFAFRLYNRSTKPMDELG